jgi:hypothetical protein
MANEQHLELLNQGVDAWNKWREEHADTQTDLSGADLHRANLVGADLHEANLIGTNLSGAILPKAHLIAANLSGANLSRANLSRAHLIMANLSGADLSSTDLSMANLSGANLSGATLRSASLVKTDFSGANLTDCSIYGVSAWGLKLEGATQLNLLITPENESAITVDNLEVAQFIYSSNKLIDGALKSSKKPPRKSRQNGASIAMRTTRKTPRLGRGKQR